jgi:hypothetical protein
VPASRPSQAGSENGKAWAQIEALKQRGTAGKTTRKAFKYDEDEPLELVMDVKLRKPDQ